jgi:hypothetical protein
VVNFHLFIFLSAQENEPKEGEELMAGKLRAGAIVRTEWRRE